jgi:hypothetical protein
MYCQIRARHIRLFGGTNLTIEREIERSSVPREEISILDVDNIADTIFDINRKIPRSKIPALLLGW